MLQVKEENILVGTKERIPHPTIINARPGWLE
jgi:hypothetical protein